MIIRSVARILLSLAAVTPAFATVAVTSPANNTTVNPTVTYVANATSSTCAKGVAAMGVYVDNSLDYVVNGTSLNTTLTLKPGVHRTVVQEWDNCGGATTAVVSLTVNDAASVAITSPVNGATVSTVPLFVATATTGCAQGVAAMGVYVNQTKVYSVPGAKLSTQLTLAAGTQNATIQEWDNCGGTAKSTLALKVVPTTVIGNPVPPTAPVIVIPAPSTPVAPPTATAISNIQSVSNWNAWAEYPPVYDICTANCSGINFEMTPHESAVSLSGNATKFSISGTDSYADVLWSNKLIGVASTLGMTDQEHAILPTVHNMTLDLDIFPTNMAVTQDIELDLNLYMNSLGFEWGTQCNHLNGGVWDYWDNVNAHWIHTAIPCTLVDKAWNHITITTKRLPNNDLLYETITQNGVTSNLNITVPPFNVPSSWYGMTVNYQLDGNKTMAANTQYVDNMKLTYW